MTVGQMHSSSAIHSLTIDWPAWDARRMTERQWYERLPDDPPPPRLYVARGPTPGLWTFKPGVPDHETGEAVLTRWRRQYPDQAAALLWNETVIEDKATRRIRLAREKQGREAPYFERLAAEADSEGRPDEAARYRLMAGLFGATNRPL